MLIISFCLSYYFVVVVVVERN